MTQERQDRVGMWARACFGNDLFTPRERVMRVLEEAIELAQAEGLTEEETTRVAHHVFGRPVGKPATELGNLRFTILAYAAARGFSAEEVERVEVDRVLSKSPEYFRARREAKAAAGIL